MGAGLAAAAGGACRAAPKERDQSCCKLPSPSVAPTIAASTMVMSAIDTVPSRLGARGGVRAEAGGAKAGDSAEMGFGGGANDTEAVA